METIKETFDLHITATEDGNIKMKGKVECSPMFLTEVFIQALKKTCESEDIVAPIEFCIAASTSLNGRILADALAVRNDIRGMLEEENNDNNK